LVILLDEPGRPGKPDIFDYDNQSVSLKWTKPDADGGRPLTHYTVEMKDKLSANWVEVFKTADTTCEAKVEGLKEKQVYQFRIRAHNKAGSSEPSDPTDNHICKHKNRECKLHIQALNRVQLTRKTFLQVARTLTQCLLFNILQLNALKTEEWS
jgi:Fibronectin type III domain